MKAAKVLFDNKASMPDTAKLKKALGGVFQAYREILAMVEGYEQEWKFYGSKIGWQFKVTHKGKALFYLTPLERSFRMGFAVRDKEKQALLNSKLPHKTKEALATASKFPEGHPLHVQVNSEDDVSTVRLIVDTLKSLRT